MASSSVSWLAAVGAETPSSFAIAVATVVAFRATVSASSAADSAADNAEAASIFAVERPRLASSNNALESPISLSAASNASATAVFATANASSAAVASASMAHPSSTFSTARLYRLLWEEGLLSPLPSI